MADRNGRALWVSISLQTDNRKINEKKKIFKMS